MEKKIHISQIFLWISIVILIAVLLWWVVGESPGIQHLALGITIFGAGLSWIGIHISYRSERVMIHTAKSIKQLYNDHIEILKRIKT